VHKIQPTGREIFFDRNDIIVSKTNLKGHITYANQTFLEIAGYSEDEVMGQPHNIIRHPDMPRCVFKLLWDTLEGGSEIFAYVVNMAKNGDHYWVLAHVTPSYDVNGTTIGYHSNRRVANLEIVQNTIAPLYRGLCEIESAASGPKEGLQASFNQVLALMSEQQTEYDEFVSSLMQAA